MITFRFIVKIYNNTLYGDNRGISFVNVATGGTHIIQNNIISGTVRLNTASVTDAVTGGYNFQAAWTSGYLVSESIANLN